MDGGAVTVSRMVVLMCDGAPDLCDEESPVGMDLSEARSLARAAGWHVGRTLDQNDYCPRHASNDGGARP